VYFVSALTGEGVPGLKDAIAALIVSAPAPPVPAPAPVKTQLRARDDGRPVVERASWGFVVSGRRVEQLMERTDLDS
jgi:hypothetical protein